MYMQDDDFTIPPPPSNKRRAANGGYSVSSGGFTGNTGAVSARQPVLRDVKFPMHFVSTKSVNLDSNGSTATFSIDSVPPRIPSNAVEVRASLVQCSIPAAIEGWSSTTSTVTSDETVNVTLGMLPHVELGTNTDATFTVSFTMSNASTYSGVADLNYNDLEAARLGTLYEFTELMVDRLNVAWALACYQDDLPYATSRPFSTYITSTSPNSTDGQLLPLSPYYSIRFDYPGNDDFIYRSNNNANEYIDTMTVAINHGSGTPPSYGVNTMNSFANVATTTMYDSSILPYDGLAYITAGITSAIENQAQTENYAVSAITVPAGNYRSVDELVAVLNAGLASDSELLYYPLCTETGSNDIILGREYPNLKKWQLGATLAQDGNVKSSTPRSLVLSATQASAPGVCALLGYDTSDVTITLATPDKVYSETPRIPDDQPVFIYDTAFLSSDTTSSAYQGATTCDVKSLTIETNFTVGGTNQDGQLSQVLATVPMNASDSSGRITHKPSAVLSVDCTNSMKSDSQTDLVIRLLDQDRSPLVFSDTSDPWIVSILLSWKEEIAADRLLAMDTETKFR